jgi:arylsulfatase A-like enzyme
VHGLVQNTDVLPTLMRQLGLEPPPGLDGVDLSDLLAGRSRDSPREYVYACTPYPREYRTFFETIRTAQGKLVRSRRNELVYHDLAQDPGESENTVSSLDPQVLESLLAALDGFDRTPIVPGPRPELPENLQERLRSLGYVE